MVIDLRSATVSLLLLKTAFHINDYKPRSLEFFLFCFYCQHTATLHKSLILVPQFPSLSNGEDRSLPPWGHLTPLIAVELNPFQPQKILPASIFYTKLPQKSLVKDDDTPPQSISLALGGENVLWALPGDFWGVDGPY